MNMRIHEQGKSAIRPADADATTIEDSKRSSKKEKSETSRPSAQAADVIDLGGKTASKPAGQIFDRETNAFLRAQGHPAGAGLNAAEARPTSGALADFDASAVSRGQHHGSASNPFGSRFGELASAMGVGPGRATDDAMKTRILGGMTSPVNGAPPTVSSVAGALGVSVPRRAVPATSRPIASPRAGQQMDAPASDSSGTTPPNDSSASAPPAKEPGVFDKIMNFVKSIWQSDTDAINGGAVATTNAGKAAGATAGTVIGATTTILTANTGSPSEKQDEFNGIKALLTAKERGGGHEQMKAYGDCFGDPTCEDSKPPVAPHSGTQMPAPEDGSAPANEGESAARARLLADLKLAHLDTRPAALGDDKAGLANPNPVGRATIRAAEHQRGSAPLSSTRSPRSDQATNPVRGDSDSQAAHPSGPLDPFTDGESVADPPKGGGVDAPASNADEREGA